MLGKAIYELWGYGNDYSQVHQDVHRRSSHRWETFQWSSFRFDIDAYQGKRGRDEQRSIIESFGYLNLLGQIKMIGPEQGFCVFEDWVHGSCSTAGPRRIYFGRWIADGGRDMVRHFDLKKRRYISTTSMDSELALVTANLCLASPDKIFYDPFVGTGSFPIASAHFGAMTLGSDIDGRMLRGTQPGLNLQSNFKQYGLEAKWIDGFIADLTNTPIRPTRWLDGIICDPPYGVREGLRVLGHRDPERGRGEMFVNGQPAHLYVTHQLHIGLSQRAIIWPFELD